MSISVTILVNSLYKYIRKLILKTDIVILNKFSAKAIE